MKLNKSFGDTEPRSAVVLPPVKSANNVVQAKTSITKPWLQSAADAFVQARTPLLATSASSVPARNSGSPIQCVFEGKMYTKGHRLTREFIKYIISEYDVVEADILVVYNGFAEQASYPTIGQIENKLKKKRRKPSDDGVEVKRIKYNPKPRDGEGNEFNRTQLTIETTGRLKRSCSYDSLATHRPMFVHGGKECGKYTNVNDNATYSIAGYEVDNVTHLLGGTQSGENVMDNTSVTHAEHQQIILFEEQIQKDAHNLKARIGIEGAVTLHLHISKSPCKEICVGQIEALLKAHPALNVQLYLETPYLANDPENGMQEQATALSEMFDRINTVGKKRISYQPVSAHATKDADCNTPFTQWGTLSNGIEANDMLFTMGTVSEKPHLSKERFKKFRQTKLKNHQGYVSNLTK